MGGYRNKLQIINISTNNPERYIDPSGHIAIELAVIVISAVVAGMAVEAGIQKFIEKKVCIDYNRIVGEGLFSGAISAISFGTGNLLKCTIGPLALKNALSAGTGLTAKLAAALIANAAGGAASEAAEEMAHQFFVEGRTFSQIDYRQIGISAALGTVVSAGSTLAGAGIDRLKAKRVAKAAGGIVGNAEDVLPARMQLQYFAGEAIEDGKNKATTIDYSYKFDRELVNFNDGYKIRTTVDKDLILVQYSSDAPDASLCYWTTADEANRITTLNDYMDKLALSKDWGNRNTVKVARVPAGTNVKYAVGTAKEQLLIADPRPGGGVQYLFNQFNTDWITEIRNFSN